MSQSRFAKTPTREPVLAQQPAPIERKHADFTALVDKVKAQVVGMQLNSDYTRQILDGIDQIAKATE